MLRDFNVPLTHPDGEKFIAPPTLKKDKFGQVIKDKEGKPIIEKESEEITVKTLIYNCLLMNSQDDMNESGELKYKRFKLAEKVSKEEPQDYSLDELKAIQDRVGKHASAAEIGCAYDLLDPKETGKVANKKKP